MDIVSPQSDPVLVTGAAGFIGYFLSRALIERGYSVTGVDNLNTYYDLELKQARLQQLEKLEGFTFHKIDLADRKRTDRLFENQSFAAVIHLAAQAGVRYSISDPHEYIPANISGFFNVLDAVYRTGTKHFLYASSSSVYGSRSTQPFSTGEPADYPVNLYAATKRSNELMAYSYAHLYDLPVTGLRFFTVYGPWGRPDMAYYKFTRAILAGETIQVHNHGDMRRDFTYIDDVIEPVIRLMNILPERNGDIPPWQVYNIGRNNPEQLMHVIGLIEKAVGKKAKMEMLPMQPGEIIETWSDSSPLAAATGYSPQISLEDGIARFVEWYMEFHHAETEVSSG